MQQLRHRQYQKHLHYDDLVLTAMSENSTRVNYNSTATATATTLIAATAFSNGAARVFESLRVIPVDGLRFHK